MKRTCIQCGKEFELSNSEIGFYKKRKLALPKRCKECREKNRKDKTEKSSYKAGTKEQGMKQKKTPVSQEVSAKLSASAVMEQKSKMFLSPRRVSVIFCVLAILYFAVFGQQNEGTPVDNKQQDTEIVYTFRSEELFESHYEKHGMEMGFATPDDYLEGANLVIADPDALHKTEAEDGDDVYFLEDTNEFVVVSTDGYIRTYFEPEDGIEYFERQ